MKFFVIGLFVFVFGPVVFAKSTYVRGHYRSNGTYVQPHHRTAPNHTVYDNYSTKGNINPYNGKKGTVNPYNDNLYNNNSNNAE